VVLGLATTTACVGDSTNTSIVNPDGGGTQDAGVGQQDASSNNSPDSGSQDSGIDSSMSDAADAAVANCDLSKPFGPVSEVPNVNTSAAETDPRISSDGLYLYFSRDDGEGGLTNKLFYSKRATVNDAFGVAVPMTALNTSNVNQAPSPSSDQLTLYYAAGTSFGTLDIFVTPKRAGLAVDFAVGSPISAINSVSSDDQPFISQDGMTLYFTSNRANGGDFRLFRSKSVAGMFGTPEDIAELNTASLDQDIRPVPSSDELTMYFTSTRTSGNFDIWVSHRMSTADAFGAPVVVSELNSTSADMSGSLTPDGCTIYFFSNRPSGAGNLDIYQATKPK
jgi:hypothetical protein